MSRQLTNYVSTMSGRINRFQPKTKEELKMAVLAYFDNKEETIKRYGFMNDWDVSLIPQTSVFKYPYKF